MKKNKILNFVLGFLLMHLFPLTSNAQPDYLSREYTMLKSFHDVIEYDSGYFVSSSPRIIKVNFSGDTIIDRVIQFKKPGSHLFVMHKTSDNKLICIGYNKNGNNATEFVSKLNFNLDTIWVKYYGEISLFNEVGTIIHDTIIIGYLGSGYNIHILMLDTNGVLIQHRIHPKYPGSIGMILWNIAPVNAWKYVIAVEYSYYNTWYQDYFYSTNICVSDSNQYYYIETFNEYRYGSGTSQSFIFYDSIIDRIKFFYHFSQMWNAVELDIFTLSGQLIASKGIYDDDANITGEAWWPCDIAMLKNGSFVISGQYERIYQDIKGGFIMRCGPHGEWNWFRKYKEIQTTGIGNGSLYAITETENYFLASVGQGTKAWLLVVDSLGCEAPGVCWVGEEEMPASLQIAELEVFPNPVRDEVWVKCASPLSDIEFYTMNGQRMFISALANEQPLRIDIRTWPEGLYLVRARLQNGRVLTQKMMKCYP